MTNCQINELIEDRFEFLTDRFREISDTVPSVDRLFEIEITKLYDLRYSENPSYRVYFDTTDIEMKEYYDLGWDCTETGIPNELHGAGIILGTKAFLKIKEKYADYLENEALVIKFDKLAKELYIDGSSDALYYHWLKREYKEFENRESQPKEDKTGVVYKNQIQRIAVLNELGVLEFILNKYKTDNAFNYSKAAKIIESFTGINAEHTRTSLEAIFKFKDVNDSGHPLKNEENRKFIEQTKKKLKIDK